MGGATHGPGVDRSNAPKLTTPAHQKNSTVEYRTEDHGAQRYIYVRVTRSMHLNRPLGDAAKLYKKSVSWWNIATQETRAEAITEIERRLGRPIMLDEYARLQSKTIQLSSGVDTTVSLYLDL